MTKNLALSPDVIDLLENYRSALPDNFHDFDRDSFGTANLLATCGFSLKIVKDPHGELTVTDDPPS